MSHATPCTFRSSEPLSGVVHKCRVYDVCVESDASLRLPVCAQCRYRTSDPNATPPEHPGRWRPRMTQPRDTLQCVHLLEVIGEVDARDCTCTGKTDVWQCDLHGQCTPLAKVPGYKSCRAGECDDFQEPIE